MERGSQLRGLVVEYCGIGRWESSFHVYPTKKANLGNRLKPNQYPTTPYQ
jgi:hypothetical protein